MFEKIKAWIKRKRETAREQQAADRLIKHIEQALGFELYEWQRLYIITGIWQPPEGRLHGRTTAYILRLLLDQSKPLLLYEFSQVAAYADKKKRAEYGEGYYKKYAAGNGTKYYRVRKSWTDAASQLGAFTSLENAKSACKAGYTVYDDNGKAVYTAAGQQASAGVPFSVQVDILDLNIRTGAGTNYAKTGETTGKGVFTIVEVKAGQGASVGWGRLKSGAGWISLDYATRLA